MTAYICHHGIKGQRWGVRRFQNEDGTLTKKGQKRVMERRKESDKLSDKIYSKSIKRDKYLKKAEKIHAKKDLGRSNRYAKKAYKYAIKADKIRKWNSDISDLKLKLENDVKASKYEIKSYKKKLKSERLSKSAAYSWRALRFVRKAGKQSVKMAKYSKRIANNNVFLNALNVPITEIPKY